MKQKLIIILIACIAFGTFMTCAFSQNSPNELKKRVAQKDISSVAVDWMARETEGRLYKRIFESSDEGDCNAIKYALEDIVPIDTSLMARATSIQLASHGSVHITYEDGQEEQIDVGCGYGYFAGGSRMVASSFHSWGLTKWLMRLIDQCENCGRLNLYAGCFVPMAGKDPLGDVIELRLTLDKETVIKGEDIHARLTFTNTGEMPVYFYGYCGFNIWFEMKDQWDRRRFYMIVDRSYESKMPQEQDFIGLKKGETYTCNRLVGGKSFMSGTPRYYGTHFLSAGYESIASYDDYFSGYLGGVLAPTIHFAQSQPVKVNLVRNWVEFQKQFKQMPENGDKDMVGVYLGPPDNKIPNFKDERGQPVSEAFLKLDEWIYEQPFADKEGQRLRVTITFQKDQVAGVREELIK